jgi:hypothetical protein
MAREVAGAILDKIYTKRGEFRLGEVVTDTAGNEYRFIKFNAGDGAATGTVGHLVVGLDTGGNFDFWEGTNDLNSATIKAILQRAFGFLQAALTDGAYGFVQKSGPNKQVILTDGSVAQDQQLMAHASTTGAVDSHDNTAATVLGTALEADGTTSANQLDAGQVDIRIP